MMRSLFTKQKQSPSNAKAPTWLGRYWKKAEAHFVRVLTRYEAKASTGQKKKALLLFMGCMTLVFSYWLYQGITGRHFRINTLQSRPAPVILEEKRPGNLVTTMHQHRDTLPDSTSIK